MTYILTLHLADIIALLWKISFLSGVEKCDKNTEIIQEDHSPAVKTNIAAKNTRTEQSTLANISLRSLLRAYRALAPSIAIILRLKLLAM